jgi:hypothetical protein
MFEVWKAVDGSEKAERILEGWGLSPHVVIGKALKSEFEWLIGILQ